MSERFPWNGDNRELEYLQSEGQEPDTEFNRLEFLNGPLNSGIFDRPIRTDSDCHGGQTKDGKDGG